MTPVVPVPLPHAACPLCGGPNGCAPAAGGSFGAACWCETVTFDAALLARVPAAARGRACICARCAAMDGSADALATRQAARPRTR